MTAVAEPQPDLIAQGLVEDMPEEDYHAHPALSSTGLRQISPPSCPARFKHLREHPEDKPALSYGKAAHAHVLGTGPELVVIDADSRRKNATKDQIAEIQARGAIDLLPPEMDRIKAMADRLRNHPVAGRYLTSPNGRTELSGFWRDERSRVDMRVRWDLLFTPPGQAAIVVDYKTTAGRADEESVAKAVEKFGYHQQGAHYTAAVPALGLAHDARFVLIVQEKEPPFLVSVFELGGLWLAIGENRNQYAADLYARCVERNEWPDYTGDRVRDLRVLPWVERNHDSALERGVFDLDNE